MPRQKNGSSTSGEAIRDRFLERAGELWDKHYAEAEEVLKESESKTICLTFKADIDCSESAPVLVTTIRFSEVHTDEKKDTMEDPSQPNLWTEGLENGEKRSNRKKDQREENAEQPDK